MMIFRLFCCSLSFGLLAAALTPGQALAQKPSEDDGPVGIFQSRGEYYQFMGDAKQAAYGPNGTPELQAMIPLLNDIALNQPIGSTAGKYQTEGSTIGMLSDDNIRKELEIVDSQYEQLKRMNDEIQKRMASQIRELDFANSKNLADQINALRERAARDLDSVLLPHQVNRLRQIRTQSKLKRQTLAELITSDPIRSELEVTESQSEDLLSAEKKIEQELAREIEALRVKARKRLISRLKPAQQAKLESKLGDWFTFADAKPRKSQTANKSKAQK